MFEHCSNVIVSSTSCKQQRQNKETSKWHKRKLQIMNATSLHTKKKKEGKEQVAQNQEERNDEAPTLVHKRNKGCVTLWPCHLHLKVS
jgi:hypothetical protein